MTDQQDKLRIVAEWMGWKLSEDHDGFIIYQEGDFNGITVRRDGKVIGPDHLLTGDGRSEIEENLSNAGWVIATIKNLERSQVVLSRKKRFAAYTTFADTPEQALVDAVVEMIEGE